MTFKAAVRVDRKNEKIEPVMIGRVGVDSGMMLIIDPANVKEFYQAIADVRDRGAKSADDGSNFDWEGEFAKATRGLAVAVRTVDGDGYYAVHIDTANERLVVDLSDRHS